MTGSLLYFSETEGFLPYVKIKYIHIYIICASILVSHGFGRLGWLQYHSTINSSQQQQSNTTKIKDQEKKITVFLNTYCYHEWKWVLQQNGFHYDWVHTDLSFQCGDMNHAAPPILSSMPNWQNSKSLSKTRNPQQCWIISVDIRSLHIVLCNDP